MQFIIQFLFLAFAISFVMSGTYFDNPKIIIKTGFKYWGLVSGTGVILGSVLYFIG